MTTGCNPSRGVIPCRLTKIVGFQVVPADIPSGNGSKPTLAHPPADASVGSVRAQTIAPTTTKTRIEHLLRFAYGSYTARAARGPRYRPFGTAMVSTFGGARSRPALPAALPDDEERGREHDRRTRDEDVQANAGDLVRRVDPQRLDPEAADAVDEHVQREQPAWPDAPLEATLDEQEHSSRGEAPERLVEKRRMEGLGVDVVDRPVLGIDLEAPGQVGRLAEELLVPPVAEATDALRDEQPRRDAVGELARPTRRSASRRSRPRCSRARSRPRRRARPSRSRPAPTTRPEARSSS